MSAEGIFVLQRGRLSLNHVSATDQSSSICGGRDRRNACAHQDLSSLVPGARRFCRGPFSATCCSHCIRAVVLRDLLGAGLSIFPMSSATPSHCPSESSYLLHYFQALRALLLTSIIFHQGQWRRSTRLVTADKFAAWHASTENNGLILLRTPFHRNRLLLTNPKAFADVLVNNAYDFEKPTLIRNFLRKILGDGLIVVEGDEHKFQRKNILLAFSFRHIRELYTIMWLKSVAMVEQISIKMLEAD
jgi:hypothetical protein